jgi:hypothetical protein
VLTIISDKHQASCFLYRFQSYHDPTAVGSKNKMKQSRRHKVIVFSIVCFISVLVCLWNRNQTNSSELKSAVDNSRFQSKEEIEAMQRVVHQGEHMHMEVGKYLFCNLEL